MIKDEAVSLLYIIELTSINSMFKFSNSNTSCTVHDHKECFSLDEANKYFDDMYKTAKSWADRASFSQDRFRVLMTAQEINDSSKNILEAFKMLEAANAVSCPASADAIHKHKEIFDGEIVKQKILLQNGLDYRFKLSSYNEKNKLLEQVIVNVPVSARDYNEYQETVKSIEEKIANMQYYISSRGYTRKTDLYALTSKSVARYFDGTIESYSFAPCKIYVEDYQVTFKHSPEEVRVKQSEAIHPYFGDLADWYSI